MMAFVTVAYERAVSAPPIPRPALGGGARGSTVSIGIRSGARPILRMAVSVYTQCPRCSPRSRWHGFLIADPLVVGLGAAHSPGQ
jgi:hypothetical protein